MSGTVLWLSFVIAACIVAWFAGQLVTRIKDPVRHWCCLVGAVALLLLWTALIRNPTLAVQVIPVSALARLEGVGAAPLFVFIVSVGWRLSIVRRQRVLMVVSMFLCAAYFFQGGFWMMQPTPSNAFADRTKLYVVRQTQDYSCVPAASATALRMLGIHSDEAEMARLTETRPGSGATLLRAFNGLNIRLEHTDITPLLLEPDYDLLMGIRPPILTPLRYDTTRLHMVTILEVRPHLVMVADPEVGVEFLSRRNFEEYYYGQVIAFDGARERASGADVLAQFPDVTDPDKHQQMLAKHYQAAHRQPGPSVLR